MKQPKERLFLGKRIPQGEGRAGNDVRSARGEQYRINLQFEKSPEGAASALENLGIVESRVKGEVFVVLLAHETERGPHLQRVLTRKELLTLMDPKQTQGTRQAPAKV